MTQINPFVGSVSQSGGVQRQQSAEKSQQARRAAEAQKDSALAGDRFEHAVESPEGLPPIHDEQKNDPKKKRQQQKHPKPDKNDTDEEPGLDLTA